MEAVSTNGEKYVPKARLSHKKEGKEKKESLAVAAEWLDDDDRPFKWEN
jgi:hypothetical protein